MPPERRHGRLAGEDDGDGQRVPACVERECRRYLECDILAYGFARARSSACDLWAMLLARLFKSLPLTCPHGGADRRIIALVTDAAPIERILTPIGEPPCPPAIAPARWGGCSRADAGRGPPQPT